MNSTKKSKNDTPFSNADDSDYNNSDEYEDTDYFYNLCSPENTINMKGTKFTIIKNIYQGKSSRIDCVINHKNECYVLKQVKFLDEYTKKLILNEIELLQELNQNEDNRAILFYGSEPIDDNKMLILLELGEKDLGCVVESSENIKPYELRYLWQEMLKCVQFIHRFNIVHGNLCPANFLYVNSSLKLLDFNLAKVIDPDQTSTIIDFKNDNPYASPEMRGLTPKLGPAADIYSVGCILYKIVYKTLPDKNYPQFPEIPNHEDSIYLRDVLRGCLNSNPHKRFTIDQLLSHPYLSFGVSSFINKGISIKENFHNLGYQIQTTKCMDLDFNCEEAQPIIASLVQSLKQGKQMELIQ